MKMTLLVWSIILLSACSNLGNSSSDINKCSELAYEKNKAHSDTPIDHIYNQCVLKKSQAREKQQKDKNIDSFMDFVLDIFWPRKGT